MSRPIVGRRSLGATPAVLAVASALVLAACSDSGAGGGSAGEATTTTAASALRDPVSLPVGGTVAVAGFSVTVTEVVSGTDPRDRTVVDAEVEITNVGPGPARFAPRVVLSAPEHPAARPSQLPSDELPPGATVEHTLRFAVAAGFPLAESRLLFGEPGENQAALELDGRGGVSRLPLGLPGGAEAQVGHMAVVVQGGTVRWDDPVNHEMLTDGRALVVVRFDALRGVGGSPNLTSANLRLRLADGTVVPTRPDGHSSPNVVIERNGVASGLVARFEVPDPVTSPLTLVVAGPYGDGGTDVAGEVVIRF